MRFEMRASIQIKDTTFGYRTGKSELPVLRHVDLEFFEGEMACLMGPNGIGKSTLIRTIAGLQPALHGDILINNQPIDQSSVSDLAKDISLVLTTIPFVGNLTVEQIVEMGRYPFTNWFNKMSTEDQRIVQKSMDLAGVDQLKSKKFNTLSDGQKQKVLIARALAQNGKILILDEPTSHLDLNNRVEIMKLMKELASEQGKTVIISTHEMDLALQITDRLILISPEGHIHSGIPEDLVLNETIDSTFQLKGYDLKRGTITGKVTGKNVSLIGEDYPYLWTKNALSRSGFEVSEDSEIAIYIEWDNQEPGSQIVWKVQTSEKEDQFQTVSALLDGLRKLF